MAIDDTGAGAPVEYTDAEPLAAPEEYRVALRAVRDKHGISERELAMLRAHCRADDHTITATELAVAAGYKDYSSANLYYGKFARRLSDALGIEPSKRRSGSIAWWRVLAYGRTDQEVGEHFEWTMRPEFVETLQAMKWA